MGRPPLLSLDPEQARLFRRLVREKLRTTKKRQRDLVNLRGVEERSERWFQNALSQDRRLPLKTAEDIIRRLVMAGVVSSLQDLRQFWKLLPAGDSQVTGPILIVFPGQSTSLARALAAEATHVNGIGLSKQPRLAKRFEKFLRANYEDILMNESGPREALPLIAKTMRQRYGPYWYAIFSGNGRLVTKAWPRLKKAAAELKGPRLAKSAFERELLQLIFAARKGAEHD